MRATPQTRVQKDDAAAQISALADDTVAEANIESLIRAKGYEDAVVMLGDGSANIVVAPPDGGLQAEDVAVIRDIVISETGMTAGQIKNCGSILIDSVYFYFAFYTNCAIMLLDNAG